MEEVAVTTDVDPDVDDDTWSRVCSASAPSVALAAETRVSRTEERMNVTDTDVISRTASVKWGVHGRIACHIDDCPVGGDADVDCSACMSRIVSRIFGFRGWCNTLDITICKYFFRHRECLETRLKDPKERRLVIAERYASS